MEQETKPKRATSKRVKSPEQQIADLQKLVKDMNIRMNDMINNPPKIEPDISGELKQEDYIEVISLCSNPLTLTTESNGRGFPYMFPRFGDISQIVYSDLQLLIKSHGSGLYTDFFREGYVYINDPRIIKKSGFGKIYDKILNYEEMLEVLKCNSDNCVTLFKRTNVKQKLNICEMIIDRISSGEKMDLNIVDVMARDAGVDITSISESTRKHKEMLAKK